MGIFLRKIILSFILFFSMISAGLSQEDWSDGASIFSSPNNAFSKSSRYRKKPDKVRKKKTTKSFINRGHKSCGFPVSSKRYIFGRESRKLVPERYAFLKKAIGIIQDYKSGEACTAFCVGPDTIATASFCLPSSSPVSHFLFTIGSSERDLRASPLKTDSTGKSKKYIIRGSDRIKKSVPINVSNQWAVARLLLNICDPSFIKLKSLSKRELAKASRAGKINMSEYASNFKGLRKLSYESNCGICLNFREKKLRNLSRQFTNFRKTILHRCDVGPISAGAPLLLETKEGLRAVAIQSGGYEYRTLLINIKGKKRKVIRRGKFQFLANTAVHISQIQKAIETLKKR